ncbi:MAG: hypothetical protein JNM46_00245 [Anaerolineales bacterium]|nr:hypothetical protein [Anaerolineales bacterium]
MDELWYRGYRTRGTPTAIADKVVKEIKKRNLGQYAPRICTEPTKTKRPDELYFFIAINSEVIGQPPSEIIELEKWLRLQHINIFPASECIFQEDFKKHWLQRFREIAYTRQLAEWMPQAIETSIDYNPFDLSEEPVPDEKARQSYNHLLYWLSAHGNGSWQGYRSACKELKLEKANEPRFLFRRLRSLGHSEYIDEGHWTIAPSCLVKIESEDQDHKYFIAGGQSPNLINSFRNQEVTAQSNLGAPDSVFISFKSNLEVQTLLPEISRQLNTQLMLLGNMSKKIADLLPNIQGWQQSFLREISIFPELYKILKWTGKDFSKWVKSPDEFGMYKLTHHNVDGIPVDYYYFFDPGQGKWFQGDWYGLRYLANRHLERIPIFIHAYPENYFYIPIGDRIPDIYERSLILASGELPTIHKDGIIYKNVSLSLAELIAAKLGARIDRRNDVT